MARVVLVCGGRSYANFDRVRHVLDELHVADPITLLVHGACGWDLDKPDHHMYATLRGADRHAHYWAMLRGVPVRPEPAAWTEYGRSAGPRRNAFMLIEHQPDLVVAFPGGDGTGDMTGRAGTLGFDVLWVDNTGEGHQRLVEGKSRGKPCSS